MKLVLPVACDHYSAFSQLFVPSTEMPDVVVAPMHSETA